MDAYILDWLQMLVRWLHLITGIAWIGSSFYFVWLDNHLEVPPKDPNPRVYGEIWSVHGGGFYHNRKFLSGPGWIPEKLHWFKYEAYFTWLSGMGLLGLLYWAGASSFMIDPEVMPLEPWQAVGIGAGVLVLGWLIYEGLCRTSLVESGLDFAVIGLVVLGGLAYGLSQLLGGRAAFIHIGAMLGTCMVANVFFTIIPGQKKMVAAIAAGQEPDPRYGLRGKQRSVHNNYLTLPVLFIMISNHYPMTFSGRWNWAVLLVITVAGMLIRHFFNLRHKGIIRPALPLAGAALLAGLAVFLYPRPDRPAGPQIVIAPERVTFANVKAVLDNRCIACHAAVPSRTGVASAPAGVRLETPADIKRWASRVHEQAVVRRSMPQGNVTGMTEEERALLAAWFKAGAAVE